MRTLLFTAFALCLLAYVSSHNAMAQNGLANETDPFNALHVSAGATVIVNQGAAERIRVTGSDTDVEGLVIETKDNTLHVYYESSVWKLFSTQPRNAKVYVTAVELTSIISESGALVTGSGTIKSDQLKISVSSGAGINLAVDAGGLILASSSGSDLKVSGTSASVNASSSSGSEIMAKDLRASKATLSASSGSDIYITVTDELNANANSGADIKVYGNPGNKNINESSGGDISLK